MGRIDALTSIRFLAALAVFVHHWLWWGGHIYWGEPGAIWEHKLTAWAWELRYGVTLFFVLSGFLLAARYFNTIFTKISFKEYWVKRFARVMPLYWSLLTILFVVYLWKLWQSPGDTWHGMVPKDFLIFYTLTQGFFSDLKFSGLGTAWSLSVEECFYLALPFVILSIRWLWQGGDSFRIPILNRSISLAWARREGIKYEILRYVIMAAVLFFFVVLFYQIGRNLRSADLLDYRRFLDRAGDVRLYTIFGRFFDFAVGIGFGVLYVKTKNVLLQKKWLPDLAIIGSTAGICLVLYRMSQSGGLDSDSGYVLNQYNAVFSAIIIYFLCSTRSLIAKALCWRPFVYMGEISFALYLIHINYMIEPVYYWVRDSNVPLLVSIVGLYAFCSLLSVIAYEVIERPAQFYILSRYFKRDDFRRPTVVRVIFGKRPKKAKKPTHVLVPQPTGLGGAPLEPMPIDAAIKTGAPRAGRAEDDSSVGDKEEEKV